MNNNPKSSGSHTAKLVFSFAAIYLIWGTTYLAMRVAVQSMPPFMMAATRFLIAGLILFVILKLRGVATPTFRQWRSASFIGSLLFLGGNGLVIWAVQEIPSGIAALVIATTPIWMTMFDWLFFRGPKPTWKVACGVMLGLVGIVLLMDPVTILAGQGTLNLYYMMALMFAPLFWCFGSLYSRKADLPSNVFMTNAAEMFCGGVALLAISFLFGESQRLDLAAIATEAWFGLLYLTIFGSMIALTSYAWLLKNAPAAKIATYSYVNPVIAVFLGWLILKEAISLQTIAAVVVILAGVILIILDRNKNKQPESDSKKPQEKVRLASPVASQETKDASKVGA